MAIHLESSAFGHQERVPVRFTGDGPNLSPPLTWSGIPEKTMELALIVDDPDAPSPDPWVHWVIYGIPVGTAALPEGVPKKEELFEPAGARQGTNDFRRIGYSGPAPPRGHGTHRYFFKLYALDKKLELPVGVRKQRLLDAMSGHILGQAELIGTYSR
ncbi:MAG: YbhB/YbcL family Raf kinase inhibitor-like protein [Bradymonadales bacterium]|nr:YbhB/YbcL family Raf kinase inhibitor-like protein [Bradymonadales bacterium]